MVRKKRKNVKASTIVKRYVEGSGRKVKVKFFDWGEPSCWACGYYSHRSIYECDIKKSDKHWSACWDRAKFLEKAHIVPFSLTEDDSPENFVLLCKQCHSKNPNTTSVKGYQAWLDSVPLWNRYDAKKREFEEALGVFGISFEEANAVLSSDEGGFGDFLYENAIAVNGRINAMTIVAALKSYMDENAYSSIDSQPKTE